VPVVILLVSVCSAPSSYAIVGYDNEKDAEHAAKEHMCAIIDNYVLAVLYLSQASNRPAGRYI